jgi:hypothetical protein
MLVLSRSGAELPVWKWGMIGIVSALGVFVSVVFLICAFAEVIWWIRAGFPKRQASRPAYLSDDVALVEESDFQPWLGIDPEDLDVFEEEDIDPDGKLKKQRYMM